MQNRRKLKLINPPFQKKFIFYVTFFVFISGISYPWLIYDFIQSLSESSSLDLTDRGKQILMWLIGIHIGYTLIIMIYCIFQSHKIAGPLYKLNNYLIKISQGNPPEKISFRKHDHFQELANSFNKAIARLQEDHMQDFAYLSEVNSYIKNLSVAVPEDKKEVLTEISNKLQEIQDRFKLNG